MAEVNDVEDEASLFDAKTGLKHFKDVFEFYNLDFHK